MSEERGSCLIEFIPKVYGALTCLFLVQLRNILFLDIVGIVNNSLSQMDFCQAEVFALVVIDDISEGVLEDCAQLVKANSIQGNKVNNVDVVYTHWLRKTASIDVGQAGFHNSKMVRTVKVEKRINEIVNRLNRTNVERKPDLKGLKAIIG